MLDDLKFLKWDFLFMKSILFECQTYKIMLISSQQEKKNNIRMRDDEAAAEEEEEETRRNVEKTKSSKCV